MTTRADLHELARRIRMDLTNAQAKLTELNRQLANLELPDDGRKPVCDLCGTTFRPRFMRDEHVYNRHGGPLPAHYAAAEKAAGLDL